MTSLAPGQQQLVRIIVMQPGIRAQEQSYRLVIDELPDAASVPPTLRGTLPAALLDSGVYCREPERAVSHDALSCEQADIPATLRCFNAGNRHIRLSHLEALTADGKVVGSIKGGGLCAPGQTALLSLKQPTRHALSSLRVYLNDDHHASQIPLRPLASRAPVLATAHAVSPD